MEPETQRLEVAWAALLESGAFLIVLGNGARLCVTGWGVYRLGSREGLEWRELLEHLPTPQPRGVA
jgi:hypothetical protein